MSEDGIDFYYDPGHNSQSEDDDSDSADGQEKYGYCADGGSLRHRKHELYNG